MHYCFPTKSDNGFVDDLTLHVAARYDTSSNPPNSSSVDAVVVFVVREAVPSNGDGAMNYRKEPTSQHRLTNSLSRSGSLP